MFSTFFILFKRKSYYYQIFCAIGIRTAIHILAKYTKGKTAPMLSKQMRILSPFASEKKNKLGPTGQFFTSRHASWARCAWLGSPASAGRSGPAGSSWWHQQNNYLRYLNNKKDSKNGKGFVWQWLFDLTFCIAIEQGMNKWGRRPDWRSAVPVLFFCHLT